jgi:hypothetical protein
MTNEREMTPEETVEYFEEMAAEFAEFDRQRKLKLADAFEGLLKEYAERRGIDTRKRGWYHLALDAREADVARGIKIAGERQRQAGRDTQKAPANTVLVAAVQKYHQAFPGRSWTWVCDRVGRDHALSGKTVARRAAAARWRK